MKWIFKSTLILAFLFIGNHADAGSAAADTWYIRPVGTCSNNGDGSAYACAASGGGVGAFSGFNNLNKTVTTGIDDGDTVKVCGNFVQADAETQFTNQAMLAIEESGSAGSPITWTGDCTSDGGSARATLTSDGTSGSLIRTYANTYITIKGNFDLVGAKDAGITAYNSASGDVAIAKNIRIEGGTTISSILAGVQPVGITYSGTNGYIGAVVINNIGVDGIFEYSGGSWTIDGARISNISINDTDGDCVQWQRNTDGNIARNVYCDKTNKDSKQCVVASTLDAQTYRMLVDNLTCLMAGGSIAIGVYSEGQMTVRGSYISNPGTYGITGALDNGTKITAYGNVIVNPVVGCFDLHKSSAGPSADIYNNTCISNTVFGVNASTSSAVLNIKNNIFVGSATYGILRGTSGTSDSYNNIFGASVASSSVGQVSVNPYFIGGTIPSTKKGFRLSPDSPLIRAGLRVGDYTDALGRWFEYKPSIGAYSYGSRDFANYMQF